MHALGAGLMRRQVWHAIGSKFVHDTQRVVFKLQREADIMSIAQLAPVRSYRFFFFNSLFFDDTSSMLDKKFVPRYYFVRFLSRHLVDAKSVIDRHDHQHPQHQQFDSSGTVFFCDFVN
jgi:hypothetical protein